MLVGVIVRAIDPTCVPISYQMGSCIHIYVEVKVPTHERQTLLCSIQTQSSSMEKSWDFGEVALQDVDLMDSSELFVFLTSDPLNFPVNDMKELESKL